MKKEAAKKIIELMAAEQNTFIMGFTDPAVQWTIMGTYHPYHGTYTTEEFKLMSAPVLATFSASHIELHTFYFDEYDDVATIQFTNHITLKTGETLENEACWVMKFTDDKIVKIDIYVDSLLLQHIKQAMT